MTPFDSWYSANIEPGLPRDMPPELRKIAKNQSAQIWNGAIDAADDECGCCHIELKVDCDTL